MNLLRPVLPDGLHGGNPLSTIGQPLHMVVANLSSNMADYSADVDDLANSPNMIWRSSNPVEFQPNGKINFLHLREEESVGIFTLTVIKPGTKTEIHAQIKKDEIPSVKETLKNISGWEKLSKEAWDKEEGDVDGSTYSFERRVQLGENFFLRWIGSHTNVGKIVLVKDTLLIDRDFTK